MRFGSNIVPLGGIPEIRNFKLSKMINNNMEKAWICEVVERPTTCIRFKIVYPNNRRWKEKMRNSCYSNISLENKIAVDVRIIILAMSVVTIAVTQTGMWNSVQRQTVNAPANYVHTNTGKSDGAHYAPQISIYADFICK